jgi:DNA-binding NarL/FixJ family response regulator
MTPNALVVSRSPEVNQLFQSVLEKARVKAECGLRPSEAILRLAKSRFDAVVIDCDAQENALEVLTSMRSGRSNRTSITIALVNGRDAIKGATNAGATFVLSKPILEDSAMRCVRAAHALILRELRRYHRQNVNTTAQLKLPSEQLQAHLSDVSEGGIGVSMVHRPNAPLKGNIKIRFTLPECRSPIEGLGELAWSKDGRFGIRFTQLTPASREELNRWLAARMDSSSQGARSPSGPKGLTPGASGLRR